MTLVNNECLRLVLVIELETVELADLLTGTVLVISV